MLFQNKFHQSDFPNIIEFLYWKSKKTRINSPGFLSERCKAVKGKYFAKPAELNIFYIFWAKQVPVQAIAADDFADKFPIFEYVVVYSLYVFLPYP